MFVIINTPFSPLKETGIAFAPAARAAALEGRGGIIHFEIMPKNINKVVDATVPILGDVVSNLSALVPMIRSSPRDHWFSDIRSWKELYPFTYEKSKPGETMKPQEVIEALEHQTRDIKDNVIVSTGVGQHQMWAAQFYRWRFPRTMVTSGGLGVSDILSYMIFGIDEPPAGRPWDSACPLRSARRWPNLTKWLLILTVMRHSA